jgi:PAS domain S-box-containing protein
MSLVATIDIISLFAVIVALIVLMHGWNRTLPKNIKLLIVGLLGLSLFQHISNVLEWGILSKALDPFEDFVELLIPILWFLLIYSYLNELTIGDLRKSEMALQESEERLRSIIQNVQAAVVVHGPDTKIIECNKLSQELLGLTEDQMLGKKAIDPLWKLFNEDGSDLPLERYPVNQVITTKNVLKDVILGIYRPNKNDVVNVLVNAVPEFDHDGNISQVIVTFMDITERERAEETLRESEAKFRDLFSLSPLPVVVTDVKTGRLIDVNAKFCELSKYTKEELLGRTPTELGFYSESERKRFITELNLSGTVKGLEFDIKIKDGSVHSALFFARPIQIENKRCILNTIYDLTERKRLEAQSQQIQRLESIATLSGGIAHEFNNALAVVSGHIDLLLMDLPDHGDVRIFGQQTMESIQRLSNLTNQLLAYARGGKYQAKSVNLSDFLRNTLPNIIPQIGFDISIDTDLPRDISSINADTTQLLMVISAVITNASEALEGEGRIRIISGDEEIDDEYAASRPGLTPGWYVGLTIKDDGEGMDEETKSRIFEPFFTTKFQGRGLGMAAVYGIIKNHDGYVYVDSEPGEGTVVRIFLPRVETNIEVLYG